MIHQYPCFSIGTRPVASCVGFDGLLQLVRAWTAQGRWPLVMSARRNQRWWQVNRHFNGNLVWYTVTCPFIYNLHQIHPLFLLENGFSHFRIILFQRTLRANEHIPKETHFPRLPLKGICLPSPRFGTPKQPTSLVFLS